MRRNTLVLLVPLIAFGLGMGVWGSLQISLRDTALAIGLCGNGDLDVGEQCDDGGWCDGIVDGTHCISDAECSGTCQSTGNDGCSADCLVQEMGTCGNGYIEWRGEICDDGNTNNGDGCDSTCQVECTDSTDCSSRPIQASPCWCDEYNIGNCMYTGLVATCTAGICETTPAIGSCTPQGPISDGGGGGSVTCNNDGTVDADETCSNCPNDVKCSTTQKCIAGVCDGANWQCKREEICGDGWVSGSEQCDDGGICTGSSMYEGVDCLSIDSADGGRAGVARCRATGGICIAQDDAKCSWDCKSCTPNNDSCFTDADCCGGSCTDGVCEA